MHWCKVRACAVICVRSIFAPSVLTISYNIKGRLRPFAHNYQEINKKALSATKTPKKSLFPELRRRNLSPCDEEDSQDLPILSLQRRLRRNLPNSEEEISISATKTQRKSPELWRRNLHLSLSYFRTLLRRGTKFTMATLCTRGNELGVIKDGEFVPHTNSVFDMVASVEAPPNYPPCSGFLYSIRTTNNVERYG